MQVQAHEAERVARNYLQRLNAEREKAGKKPLPDECAGPAAEAYARAGEKISWHGPMVAALKKSLADSAAALDASKKGKALAKPKRKTAKKKAG